MDRTESAIRDMLAAIEHGSPGGADRPGRTHGSPPGARHRPGACAGLAELESKSYPVAAIPAQLDRWLEALEPGRGVSSEEWFEELPAPEARVTLLLALLELARLQRVLLGQRRAFGALSLKRLAS